MFAMEPSKITPEMFVPVSEKVAKEWQEKLTNKYLLDTEEIRAELSDDQIVRRDALPSNARVLKYRQPCTMEYFAGRLNLQLDEDKKITSVYFA
ncbi:unnamed protein product [Cunninghamella blakesleeana]